MATRAQRVRKVGKQVAKTTGRAAAVAAAQARVREVAARQRR